MTTPHPATEAVLRYFDHTHLPPALAAVSAPFGELARAMAAQLPPGPEVTAGLRKLLEAKDCAVRAATLGPNPSAVTFAVTGESAPPASG